MLGYNGSIPGPTLRVRQGSEVIVNVTNDGDLDTTVHWHGVRLENKYDGVPHGTQLPIPVGGTFAYRIPFTDPGLYWYHRHIREDYTLEMGLYGNILVEPAEPGYWPPAHRDVILTLDDVLLEDGRIAPFSTTETTYAGRKPGEVERGLAGGVGAADHVHLLAGQRRGLRPRRAVEGRAAAAAASALSLRPTRPPAGWRPVPRRFAGPSSRHQRPGPDWPGTPHTCPGLWMAHCHIAEHRCGVTPLGRGHAVVGAEPFDEVAGVGVTDTVAALPAAP
jgi:hypothetical protein